MKRNRFFIGGRAVWCNHGGKKTFGKYTRLLTMYKAKRSFFKRNDDLVEAQQG